jgi:hypothetical protein
MARSYRRDANGRFAGGGSGGGKRGGSAPARPTSPRKPRGLVTQRRAVAKGRQKLAAKQADPAASSRSRAAQKGALTKAQNKLAAAKQSGRRRIQPGARSGVLRPGRGGARSARGAANNIRPVSARLQASRQASLSPKQFLAQEERNAAKYASKPKPASNNIVPSPKRAKPRTIQGSISRLRRMSDSFKLRSARQTARDMAKANDKGITGDISRMMLQAAPARDVRAARGIIARRATRAATAAARGSKPAAKAQAIYDNQLAPVLPKGKGKGRNNLRPGPRNTKGAPPKKRKPRKPKG